MLGLKNKLAIVTGGASGIGRSIVMRLASSGASVFSGDVDEKGNMETVGLATDLIGEVRAEYLDIGDLKSIENFKRTAFQYWENEQKNSDIIVNAAGWDKIQPFLDSTPEFTDKVLNTNLKGPINVVRAFLPSMIEANEGKIININEANEGKIINISSDAGRVGSMGETIYSGAKGGIIAFTKSLARETAKYQINVNCVCPGPTNTPLLAAQPEGMQEKLTRAIPFRRIAEPEEIADAVLFFASNMSNYITGQVLSVSGGLTMAD